MIEATAKLVFFAVVVTWVAVAITLAGALACARKRGAIPPIGEGASPLTEFVVALWPVGIPAAIAAYAGWKIADWCLTPRKPKTVSVYDEAA